MHLSTAIGDIPRPHNGSYSLRVPHDETVLLAGEADRRRVDDRHRQLDVIADEAVEELLVAVHQADEVDVAVEVRLAPVEVFEDEVHLLVLGGDGRRQEAVDAEQLALQEGEATTLEHDQGGQRWA